MGLFWKKEYFRISANFFIILSPSGVPLAKKNESVKE